MKAGSISLAFAALLASGASSASDGVVEINQVCAAVGCFAGDTGGFPVSTPADGSYVLTSNLIVPDASTSAISLGVRSSLDLNGFAIIGPTTCTGHPAVCSGTGSGVGITTSAGGGWIHDGTIRGMGSHGIRGGSDTRVEAVRVESNGGHGIIGDSGSFGWRVERCSVNSNGGAGMVVNVGGGGSNMIRGNSVRWNGGYGVIGTDVLVLENSFVGNADEGVHAVGGGYGQNILEGNNTGGAQASGVQIGTNVCEGDTTCP